MTRARGAFLGVALACALSSMGASQAQAQLPLPIGGVGPLLAGTLNTVATQVGPNVAPLMPICKSLEPSPVKTALCAANAVGFMFVTHLPASQPGGSATDRMSLAVLGIPNPIDVNGDGVTDFTGTLSVNSLSSFAIRIDRAAGSTAAFPARIEAVLGDPSGVLPSDWVYAGYDAAGSRAPQTFSTTLTLPAAPADFPEATDVHLRVVATPTNVPLSIRGGMRDVQNGSFGRVTGGDLHYDRLPATVDVDLQVSTTRVRAEARASSEVPATLQVRADTPNVNTGARLTVTATANPLPSPTTFDLRTPVGAPVTMDLKTTNGLPTLGVDLVRDPNDQMLSTLSFHADADAIPSHIKVTQSADGISLDADPEHTPQIAQIGRLRAAVANDDELPTLPDRTDAYVLLDASSGATIAQVRRVQKLDLGFFAPSAGSAIGKITVSSRLAGERQPFHVERRDGATMTADLHDLPHVVDLTLDIAEGTVNYEGNGEAISSIDLAGSSQTKNLFGRARTLVGRITGLPAHVDLTFDLTDGLQGLTFTATQPVGDIQVIASSGRVLLADIPRGTAGGVILTDTKDRWTVGGAVSGLRSLTFDRPSATATYLKKQSTAGTFRAQYSDDGTADDAPRTFTALADALPAVAELTIDPSAVTVDYDGSTFLGTLTVDGQAEKGFFSHATLLHAVVSNLPPDIHVSLTPPRTGSTDVAASLETRPLRGGLGRPSIGAIEVHAAGNDADLTVQPSKPQGVVLINTASRTVVAVRALGVRAASVDRTGNTITGGVDLQPGPVSFDYTDARMQLHADAPDFPGQAKVTVDTDDLTVDYHGFNPAGEPARISTLNVNGFADGGFAPTGPLSRVRYLEGTVTPVPDGLHLAMKPTAGAGFEASSPVDLTLKAASSPAAYELPAAGRDGVVYRDLADRFTLGARIRGLLALHAKLSDGANGGQAVDADASILPHPLSFTMETRSGLFGSTTVQVDVDDLPAPPPPVDGKPRGTYVHAFFDPGQMRAVYDASGQVGQVKATATTTGPAFFTKAKAVEAVVKKLPEKVTLVVPAPSGQQHLNVAFIAPRAVGEVRVRAAASMADLPDYLPAGEQGVIYHDEPPNQVIGAQFGLDARVLDLRSAGVGANGDATAGQFTARPGTIRTIVKTSDIDLVSTIGNFPGEVSFASSPSVGRVEYTANDTLGSVDFTFRKKTGNALFGQARAIHAHVENVPAHILLTYGVNSSTGFTLDAGNDNGVGLVELGLGYMADGPGTLLPAGVSGAVYRGSSVGVVAAFARLRGLRHVQLEPSGPSLTFDAATPQKVHVDADAPIPGGDGSYVSLTGDINNLPGHIEVTSHQSILGLALVKVLDYKASAKINSIELHARGLPGPASDADFTVAGVPPHLTMMVPAAGGDTTKTAVSFNAYGKGLDRIDVDLRSDGAARTLLGNRNVVALNDVNGLHASMRLYGFDNLSVLTPLPAMPAGTFGADVGFASAPFPLDIELDHPLGDGQVMTVRSTIEHPPQAVHVDMMNPKLTPGLPIKLNYTGTTNGQPTEIPAVDLKLVAGSVGFLGTISHIPGKAHICFDTSDYCGPHVGRYGFLSKFSLSLDSENTATHRLGIDGRLCTHVYGAMTLQHCDRYADAFVDFDHFQTGDVAFEQGTGYVPRRDANNVPYDDEFDAEDDIGHIALDTDRGPVATRGVKVDRLYVMSGVGGYRDGDLVLFDAKFFNDRDVFYDQAESAVGNYAPTPNGDTEGSYVRMKKPIYALQGHRWALTYDPPPIGLEGVQSGHADCGGGDWDVFLDSVPIDIAGIIGNFTGCAETGFGF